MSNQCKGFMGGNDELFIINNRAKKHFKNKKWNGAFLLKG